jgi:hydrogenase maturation protease
VEEQIAAARLELRTAKPRAERTVFHFPASEGLESVEEDVRILRKQEALDGEVVTTAEKVGKSLWKIRVNIANLTEVPEEWLERQDAIVMRTFASTHTILRANDAEFISLLEPSPEDAGAAAGCRNVGTWPILVGDAGLRECDTMLSSPIILYDYPQIAPESPGNLFDGAEIDEILTLRIMAMTDEEKLEARHIDERARRMLERTEALPEDDLLRLHGVLREMKPVPDEWPAPGSDAWAASTRLEGVDVRGTWVAKGDHVRIHPKRRADAMDLFLNGKVAVVEAVEQDAEGAVHLALVLEDDPGKDLGMLRQPGHRFFYTSDEVEPVKGGP